MDAQIGGEAAAGKLRENVLHGSSAGDATHGQEPDGHGWIEVAAANAAEAGDRDRERQTMG
jgi:hypothetical protein